MKQDRLDAIKQAYTLAVLAGPCAASGEDMNAVGWLLVEVERLRALVEYGAWRAEIADRG